MSGSTKALVDQALRRGELQDLLVGKEPYRLSRPYMAPTDMPTDWLRLVDEGLFPCYQATDKAKFVSDLEDAMLSLLDYPHGVYAVVSLLWAHLARESRGSAPYILPKQRLLNKISSNVRLMKSKLEQDKSWAGAQYPDGLYGEFSRIRNIVKEDYGIDLWRE